MRSKTPVIIKDPPTAMVLAARIRERMAKDPDFKTDDVPTQTAGVYEPGAVFHMIAPDGGAYTIRINRRGR